MLNLIHLVGYVIMLFYHLHMVRFFVPIFNRVKWFRGQGSKFPFTFKYSGQHLLWVTTSFFYYFLSCLLIICIWFWAFVWCIHFFLSKGRCLSCGDIRRTFRCSSPWCSLGGSEWWRCKKLSTLAYWSILIIPMIFVRSFHVYAFDTTSAIRRSLDSNWAVLRS